MKIHTYTPEYSVQVFVRTYNSGKKRIILKKIRKSPVHFEDFLVQRKTTTCEYYCVTEKNIKIKIKNVYIVRKSTHTYIVSDSCCYYCGGYTVN